MVGRVLGVLAVVVVAASGGFVEFPIEHADELSVARFKSEYADKLRPVVIRGNGRTRAEAARWTASDFVDKCGDGEITRYVSDPASAAWGGFDMANDRRVPLRDFFREVAASESSEDVYGFDYNLKCDCEAFVEDTTILPYFKQDVTVQMEMTGAAWPVLIAGMPGTRSQLHVDNSFLPFWLTLLGGRKVFRCVDLSEWNTTLVAAGVVDADGDTRFAVDAYDDETVVERFGGATIYSSVLEPGDSVYIPVAGLHGGFNVGDEPALAITGNYHDDAHHDLLVDVYCEQQVRKRVARRGSSRVAAMVKDPSCLFWAGALGDLAPTADLGDDDAPAPLGAVVYSDPWFCRKYGPGLRRGSDCGASASRCPPRPPNGGGDDDDDDADSDFVQDSNDDGVFSRQEVSLKLAQVAPRYLKSVPDDAMTWAYLRDWVTDQVADVWPLGAPQMDAKAIDAAIFAKFFDEAGDERPVESFLPRRSEL